MRLLLEWIAKHLGEFLIVAVPVYLVAGFIAEKVSMLESWKKSNSSVYFRIQNFVGRVGMVLIAIAVVFAVCWLVVQLLLFKEVSK